jgi:hypothetical protein
VSIQLWKNIAMNDTYSPNILSLDETDTLVKTLYYKEMAAIKSTSYQRSIDQSNDMRACNAALAAAEELLNQERNDRACPNPEAEKVRQTIREFVRGGLRNSIENFRNMTLRNEYILEIRKSANRFLERLRRLEVMQEENPLLWTVSEQSFKLAEEAANARNLVLEQTRTKLSKTASEFSKMLKEEGVDFPSLIKRYQERLQLNGDFHTLAEEDQSRVYAAIIEASGRSNKMVNIVSKAMGVLGAATIILTLGVVVWDIVESSNPTLTAVKNAVSLGAGVVGAIIGTELGIAIGAAGGPLGIFLGGLLGGFIGGFAVGEAANSIFDALVSVFSNPIPLELVDNSFSDHSLWGNPIIYAPFLPDGSELSGSLFPSQPL